MPLIITHWKIPDAKACQFRGTFMLQSEKFNSANNSLNQISLQTSKVLASALKILSVKYSNFHKASLIRLVIRVNLSGMKLSRSTQTVLVQKTQLHWNSWRLLLKTYASLIKSKWKYIVSWSISRVPVPLPTQTSRALSLRIPIFMALPKSKYPKWPGVVTSQTGSNSWTLIIKW